MSVSYCDLINAHIKLELHQSKLSSMIKIAGHRFTSSEKPSL